MVIKKNSFMKEIRTIQTKLGELVPNKGAWNKNVLGGKFSVGQPLYYWRGFF